MSFNKSDSHLKPAVSNKRFMSLDKKKAILSRGPKPLMSRRQALGRGLDNLFPPSQIQHKNMLGIEKLKPNPRQPRQVFDKNLLKDLAYSIKKNGLIQPVVVKKKGQMYEIVAGERRWRAAGLAGLHKIPVWILDQDKVNPFLSLVENLQRENLNPIELAEAYQALLKNQNISQEKLADYLNLPRPTLTNSLRLLKLSPIAKGLVLKGHLSMAVAKVLLKEKNLDKQTKWAKYFAKHQTDVRKAEAFLSAGAKKKRSLALTKKLKKEQTRALNMLRDRHGVSGQVHFRKKGGELRLRFFSDKELNFLMSLLLK